MTQPSAADEIAYFIEKMELFVAPDRDNTVERIRAELARDDIDWMEVRRNLRPRMAVELAKLKLNEEGDGVTKSHYKELSRLVEYDAEIVANLAFKLVKEDLSVRKLRSSVDAHLYDGSRTPSETSTPGVRYAKSFVASAMHFVRSHSSLFSECQVEIEPVTRRHAELPVDFLLIEDGSIRIAFEAKPKKQLFKRRQLVEVAGAHTLFRKFVQETVCVFEWNDEKSALAYCEIVETYRLENQHALLLSYPTKSGAQNYKLLRRVVDGWDEVRSDFENSITKA